MHVDKGVMTKVGKGWKIKLPTKPGGDKIVPFPVPLRVQHFASSDVNEGHEAIAERDLSLKIIKVTLVGKPEVAPNSSSSKKGNTRKTNYGKRESNPRSSRSSQPSKKPLIEQQKASASTIGGGFYNPYLAFPFSHLAPQTSAFTPHSVEDVDKSRISGIIKVKVKNETPLLSVNSVPVSGGNGAHATFKALTIGDDVVVPATGIRGSVRTLLTVLTGGTLGYIDKFSFLCQGRDANLGTDNPQLAEIVKAGSPYVAGQVQLGETILIPLKQLDDLARTKHIDLRRFRKPGSPILWVQVDDQFNPIDISKTESPATPYRLRLKNSVIGEIKNGTREGAFVPSGKVIDLPPLLWQEYSARHSKDAARPNLAGRKDGKPGDLVWLEPVKTDGDIKSAGEIASIQWARWVKGGQRLTDPVVMPKQELLPSSMSVENSHVDIVTNLFGQVAESGSKAITFGSRIRFDNLVFIDAAKNKQTFQVPLAPMSSPNPGCRAFYRDNPDPDKISESDPLKGYKIYRVADPAEKAWQFDRQGNYNDNGTLKSNSQQNGNQTVDLLKAGQIGELTVSFQGLSKLELSLLVAIMKVPWRIGGGKPLGLGLCKIDDFKIVDEFGDELPVEEFNKLESETEFNLEFAKRVYFWKKSQEPQKNVRYPRAVSRSARRNGNEIKNTRGGHAWFMRHATPNMAKDSRPSIGIKAMRVGGKLKSEIENKERFDQTPLVSGQVLQHYEPDNPDADLLFGYDLINWDGRSVIQSGNVNIYDYLEPFDEQKHIDGTEKSQGNDGRNRKSRQSQKADRKST